MSKSSGTYEAVEPDALEPSFKEVIGAREEYWRERVLNDRLRVIRLEKVCETFSRQEAEDFLIRLRLALLDQPDLGEGLAVFNPFVNRVLDEKEKRAAARATLRRRSAPPKSAHLAA